MRLPKISKIVALNVGLAVVAIALAVYSSAATSSLARARQDAVQAAEATAIALARANELKVYADSVESAARQRDAVAAARVRDAARSERAALAARASFAAAAKAASDTCAEVVFEAEKALARAEAVAEDWHDAYVEQKAATGLLEAANDSLVAALAAVTPAAEKLVEKTGELVAESAPPSIVQRLRAAITPNVGVGAAIGVDVTGRPNAVVGITIGWRPFR